MKTDNLITYTITAVWTAIIFCIGLVAYAELLNTVPAQNAFYVLYVLCANVFISVCAVAFMAWVERDKVLTMQDVKRK